eukprot:9491843-Pyramimonas_sp.AAC.1
MPARASPARPWAGCWPHRRRESLHPPWGSGLEVPLAPEPGCLMGGRLLPRRLCSAILPLEFVVAAHSMAV